MSLDEDHAHALITACLTVQQGGPIFDVTPFIPTDNLELVALLGFMASAVAELIAHEAIQAGVDPMDYWAALVLEHHQETA
jgi:hypothetical protein